MNINQYLHSPYLNTAWQAGISENKTHKDIIGLVEKAIAEEFKSSKLWLEHNKTVRWIIKIAALFNHKILIITKLVIEVIFNSFDKENVNKIFIKSSTELYKTKYNKPSDATSEGMKLIVENAKPLQVKAAGGIKNHKDAVRMINLGVDRIGTLATKEIADGNQTKNIY